MLGNIIKYLVHQSLPPVVLVSIDDYIQVCYCSVVASRLSNAVLWFSLQQAVREGSAFLINTESQNTRLQRRWWCIPVNKIFCALPFSWARYKVLWACFVRTPLFKTWRPYGKWQPSVLAVKIYRLTYADWWLKVGPVNSSKSEAWDLCPSECWWQLVPGHLSPGGVRKEPLKGWASSWLWDIPSPPYTTQAQAWPPCGDRDVELNSKDCGSSSSMMRNCLIFS